MKQRVYGVLIEKTSLCDKLNVEPEFDSILDDLAKKHNVLVITTNKNNAIFLFEMWNEANKYYNELIKYEFLTISKGEFMVEKLEEC